MRIAFIGVHGIGKTTTAKMLENYGFRMVPLEAIHLIEGLDPISRQLLYFTTYVSDFLKASSSIIEDLAFDSHPLLVLPYTEYWLSKAGVAKEDLSRTLDSFLRVLLILPKVDVLFYLRMTSVEKVIERLKMRGRRNLSEEADREYLKFIDERAKYYVKIYGDKVACRVVEINGSLEVNERVEIVLRETSVYRIKQSVESPVEADYRE